MAERRRTRSVRDSGGDSGQRSNPAHDDGELADPDETAPVEAGLDLGDYVEQGSRKGSAPRRGRAMSVQGAATAALAQITELTAKTPEGVTAIERTENGWRIGIEVIEDRRIPSSADILAMYRAEIDEDGELVSYQRVSRYPRGRGDSNGQS